MAEKNIKPDPSLPVIGLPPEVKPVPDKPYRRIPAVGRWVHYFRYGDRASGEEPAVVTQTSKSGMLNLVRILPTGATSAITAVRHIDDPFLQTNGGKELALQMGAWDYIRDKD